MTKNVQIDILLSISKRRAAKLLITRETDYALRILRALSDGRQATVPEICRREMVPSPFAYKILKKLEKGGIVRIRRGSDGGCQLAADLKTVSLYDLLTVMGAENLVNSCTQEHYECEWRKQNHSECVLHCKLMEVQQALDEQLRSYNLQRMISG